MGVGESIFQHLRAQREAQRQYRLGFMPPVREARPYRLTLDNGETTFNIVVDDFSEHGLMLRSLRVTASGDGVETGAADGLKCLVDGIVTEVVTPYGAVKCIEQEKRPANAILRTDPTADGCYFEFRIIENNEVELKHYTVSERTRERRRTPVNVGRAVFEKLADSLACAFRGSPAILR
jgi:hypothetical protein